ncbi:MAG: class I SAM-dependent methyltransferase [Acidimicrobiales bacterium]
MDERVEAALAGGDPSAERTRYGWEEWAWDASLFQGSASYYRRGRIPYAEGLEDSLATALDLRGQGRLLDIGCGPGIIALRLAQLFEEVVGVDPDPGMLEEARHASRKGRVTTASWVQMRAEDLPAGLGTFRVIAFAQSFHWMDRPKVASAVRAMIEPDGAVVQIDPGRDGVGSRPATGPHPAVPFDGIDRLRRHYLDPDRRAGQGFRNTSPSGEDAIFQAAGFLAEVRLPVADHRVLDRTTEDLVAWVFSASSTAPHLFGDKLSRFEADLRALLDEASPSGRFSVPLSDTILRIRRPSRNAGLDRLSAHR